LRRRSGATKPTGHARTSGRVRGARSRRRAGGLPRSPQRTTSHDARSWASSRDALGCAVSGCELRYASVRPQVEVTTATSSARSWSVCEGAGLWVAVAACDASDGRRPGGMPRRDGGSPSPYSGLRVALLRRCYDLPLPDARPSVRQGRVLLAPAGCRLAVFAFLPIYDFAGGIGEAGVVVVVFK
jgi:hypothetical protein